MHWLHSLPQVYPALVAGQLPLEPIPSLFCNRCGRLIPCLLGEHGFHSENLPAAVRRRREADILDAQPGDRIKPVGFPDLWLVVLAVRPVVSHAGTHALSSGVVSV
jgi:hypothetical protein